MSTTRPVGDSRPSTAWMANCRQCRTAWRRGLCAAENFGQRGSHVHAEIDGAVEEFRSMKFFHIGQQLGNGDSLQLIALMARDACEALKRVPHSAGFGQNRLDSFALLRFKVARLIQKRSVAEDDGQRVVQLLRHVSGKLAQAGKLLRVDQLLEHHGLAALGLEARGEHLEGQKIVRTQWLAR